MPNLFICLTPLQALIAQALIRQTAQPADLLMVCYPEADNAKFQHYYQQTAAQCRRSRYHIVPCRPWQRAFALPRLLDGLDSRYHTLYAASIDNAHIRQATQRLRLVVGRRIPGAQFQSVRHRLGRFQVEGLHPSLA